MATKKEALEELTRLAEECPERRIVCLDNDDTPVFINCIEVDDEDEPWLLILVRNEEEKRDMTVAKLQECLSLEYEEDPDPDGEETYLLVRLDDDENDTKDIYSCKEGIFFEHTVGDEKVIAFRSGDDWYLDDIW
ncbi:MAG: hypothetical protein J6S89_04175 [Paludibacteraceae bacterium]|jgi:hypothetical protein|nr:hypothetical protein [Paludibacteraceae bacterium]